MSDRLQEWHSKPGHGFVFYRIPGEDIQFVSGDVEVNPSQPEHGFFMAPFDREGNSPAVLIKPEIRESIESVSEIDRSNLPNLPDASDLCVISKTDYCQSLREAINQIKGGVLTKIVLSRLKTVGAKDLDPLTFLEGLCESYPTAFCYLIWTPQSGMWCGATPETLVRYEEDYWKTMALAGTLPKSSNPTWTGKEYIEQALVTQTITDNLRAAGYSVHIGERHNQEAANLVHLATEIEIDAPGNSEAGLAIAKLLHPTPAVGGLPPDIARDLIRKLEKRDRQYYTGYLGPVGMDSPAAFFVNLRCCQLFKDQMVLHLGGGITADSDPESEWDETVHKEEVLLSVMENYKA